MFKTLRNKLLFWFILLSSINLIIVWLCNSYITRRENIIISTQLLQDAHVLVLKDARAQQHFVSYETKNKVFFEEGQSKWADEHRLLMSKLIVKTKGMLDSNHSANLEIISELKTLPDRIREIDSVFTAVTVQVRRRGFKDFSLEGEMRDHAHWLEKNSSIKKEKILSLRRHEKDYIIRNELTYVDKLNDLAEQIKSQISRANIPKKDSVLFHLSMYQETFNELVSLDKALGIKDNTALKAALDNNVAALEFSLDGLITKAHDRQDVLLSELNKNYLTILIILIALSIVLSYFISRKVTMPLTELASFITRFVDSNFTAEDGNPVVRTADEIGKLTQNFTMMKDEVISRLKFFKQKVEERTGELTQAYKELDIFFYRASHDFRRPVTTFLGLASVAKISVSEPVALQLFEKVTETAMGLDKMLQKLQSISDVGVHEMSLEEVPIRELAEQTVDSLSVLIKQKNISVFIEIPFHQLILSYPRMLKIILENLIENSIFFSGKTNPFVVVRTSLSSVLIIEVEDNGQGIEDAYTPRIFEMYFRANEHSKGNGLGLYIAKKAVEKLHGTIEFISKHKEGSKFIVKLPIMSSSDDDPYS
jgi:signal transduction histidine kinase